MKRLGTLSLIFLLSLLLVACGSQDQKRPITQENSPNPILGTYQQDHPHRPGDFRISFQADTMTWADESYPVKDYVVFPKRQIVTVRAPGEHVGQTAITIPYNDGGESVYASHLVPGRSSSRRRFVRVNK